MDFGKAFSFVFEDEEWLKKVGIAGLISLIPLIGQLVVLGWGIEVTRRVIQDHPEPLPDWDDFMGYLVKGLQVLVIAFVYMLPVIVIQGCSSGILPFLNQGGNGDVLATAIAIFMACFGCLTFLYAIFAGLIMPAAIGNFAAKDELKAAFSFGEVFGMVRDNIGAYAMVLVGSLLSGFVASLGVIACVIGVLFTSAYAYAVNGHLMGQAYPGGATAPIAVAEGVVEPDFTDDF